MTLSLQVMMKERSFTLKKNLSKEFEVKDLGQPRYFLGIEIAWNPKGIVLSKIKYVLDLLTETGML